MAKTYRHTQPGYLIMGSMAAAAAIALRKLKAGPASFPLLALAGILGGVGVIFSAQTIEIEDGVLRSYYGPGIPAKKTSLDDVESVDVVKNRWYYGWGVKYTPHGWLYNVSGLGAVQIGLKSGEQFRLGTDEPEALRAAILEARRNAA